MGIFQRIDDDSASIVMAHGDAYGSSASASRFSDDGHRWIINRVIVHREHRRKGYGRKMLDRLCGMMAGAGVTDVIVAPGGYDTPLEEQRAFYRACGFQDDEAHEGVMRRRLT